MTDPTSGGQSKIDVSLPSISPEKIGSEGSMGEHAVQQIPTQALTIPTASEAAKVSSVSQEHVSAGTTSVRSGEKAEERHIQQATERKPAEQRVEEVRSSVVPLVSSREQTSPLESVNSWQRSEKAYLDGLRRELAVQYMAKTDVDPEKLKEFLQRDIAGEDAKRDFCQKFDEAFGTKNAEIFLTTIIGHLSEGPLVEIIRAEGLDIHVLQDEPPTIFAFSGESLEKLRSYVLRSEVRFSGVIAVYDAGGSHSAIASAGVDPSAPFCIHSVGKVFTGVLALRLVQKGIIKEEALSDPVQLDKKTLDKLPQKVRLFLEDPATSPTLGQLMCHEGGVGDYLTKYMGAIEEALRQEKEIPGIESPEDFLQYADETTGAPRGSYSNLGLLLVGLSLQHLTGKPFDVLLKELAEEAKMNFLSSKKPDRAVFNTAHPEAGHMCGSPAGGYWGTAQDLCAFGSWISTLWKTEPRFKELVEKYGKEFYSGGVISHPGGTRSGSAYFSVFPEQGLTVAILSNKRYPGAIEMNEVIRARMMR